MGIAQDTLNQMGKAFDDSLNELINGIKGKPVKKTAKKKPKKKDEPD